MILKYWKNMFIALLIILLILSLGKCVSNMKQSKVDKANIEAAQFKLKEYTDKSGKIITEQQQLIVNKQRDIDKLITKVDDLTKISEQVRVVTKTVIKNVEVPIDRPVYITVGDSRYLKVPAPFKKIDDKWYGFGGSIQDSGKLKLDSLYFISRPTLTFGLTKFNLRKPFKPRVPTVAYSDENPYARVVSMQNVKLNKVQSKLSLGFNCGYGVISNGQFLGTGFYGGLGASYKIF